MVYESQVLEYLRAFGEKKLFEEIELIVFRHEENLFKKDQVEKRIHKYVNRCKTFASFPTIILKQLDCDAYRLRSYLLKKYKRSEDIAVICRGDLAAYVGIKAFKKFDRSRILYDNRGLAYEESVMSYGDKIIYKINREAKRKALLASKNHCDSYNFVTHAMRDYFIQKYKYSTDIPYTVIPTLYKSESVDENIVCKIRNEIGVSNNDIVVSYVGSAAAWQSVDELYELITVILDSCEYTKILILSNSQFSEIEKMDKRFQERIIVRSVPHKDMKYYLKLMDYGIVIRSENIVNKVAAPTKIAEYITNGVKLLYKGDIGIINDLAKILDKKQLIDISETISWSKTFEKRKSDSVVIENVISEYFDMDVRQNETYNMLLTVFEKEKVM